MAKRIVFCGGGSGGHIFPLITVARYLKKIMAKLILNFFLLVQVGIWTEI